MAPLAVTTRLVWAAAAACAIDTMMGAQAEEPSATTTSEAAGEASACPGIAPSPSGCGAPCLCIFDIDRTLTGRQMNLEQCPQNEITNYTDYGYSHKYGPPYNATLSELAKVGISKTFCNKCYLGLISSGQGSGVDSEWNRYILEGLMRGEAHDAFVAAHPEAQVWSISPQATWGTPGNIKSPYVLKSPNKLKQNDAELVRKWFAQPGRGVCIQPENVWFFGDRPENIEPFQEKGMNSREVSCDSRDASLYTNHPMYPGSLVGFCGARQGEIQRVRGNFLCDALPNETDQTGGCNETNETSDSDPQGGGRHHDVTSAAHEHRLAAPALGLLALFASEVVSSMASPCA